MDYQDWSALYALTSKVALNGTSEAQFAQALTDRTQKVGAVTAISITSDPQITTDTSTGLTTFAVTEQWTITLNGVSQTETVTVKFILEDGVWKFLGAH